MGNHPHISPDAGPPLFVEDYPENGGSSRGVIGLSVQVETGREKFIKSLSRRTRFPGYSILLLRGSD